METNYKRDFPLLQQQDEHGRVLAYLDNAATTQKPRAVIDVVRDYYENYNANPHRGVYAIAERVTEAFETVRAKVAHFIGATSSEEIVFTSGTTDAINLAALSFGETIVEAGDDILISVLEHHSNLLPWQRLAKRRGAALRYLIPDPSGRITLEEVRSKLTARTKIVAITHVSNVLGLVNPIREITALAHEKGAVVLLDAAQSVPHLPIDVKALDVDFMAFSGHKMLAPAGIGVLYSKSEYLKRMEPLRLGGGIVEEVTEQTVRYLDAPWKFEAGTQNAEGVIGLGAAIDYLEAVGMSTIQQIESTLTDYAFDKLSAIPSLQIYGSATGDDRTGILAFNVADVHPHDTATILGEAGVAVRAGHHCAQPLMKWLGQHATCRMSLSFYNTTDNIDRLADALKSVRKVLGFESE